MMKIVFVLAAATAVLTTAPLATPTKAKASRWRKASMFRSGGTARIAVGRQHLSDRMS
jgi:hypothetical protein